MGQQVIPQQALSQGVPARQMNIQSVAPRDASVRVPLRMLTRKEAGCNKVKRQNRKDRQAQIHAKDEDDIQAMRESMAEFARTECVVDVEVKVAKSKD